jgi:murein DD-endopeptidase MepM/ murein hydrolase activator NlpD
MAANAAAIDQAMKYSPHTVGLDQSRSPSDSISNLKSQISNSAEAEARRAAAEFEALFLTQITSAINPSPDDEEADLFGGGASQMYRQMLSEQLATSIAQSGGVGLAENILSQLQAGKPGAAGGAGKLSQALDAARSLREETNAAGAGGVVTKKTADEASVAGKLSGDAKMPSASGHEKTHHHTHSRPSDHPAALNLPVNGRITSKFGPRRDPVHGGHRHHRGIDIAAPRGTPIEAAATGTVVFAGRQRGYGKTVIVELPDGRHTRYAHADKLMVSAGDEVRAGQVIATVGSTGRATGPHLHFEVTENGRAVNPLQVLAKDSTLARR